MKSVKALMVHPPFNAGSFWNYKETCDLAGAKYPASPLGLITVAAMLPSHWDIRLIDQNTVELSDEQIEWADLVMAGGMLPQQFGALELIERCRSLGKTIAVGGPDATTTPHLYERADFRILGEAEDVLGQFVADFEDGATSGYYQAPKFQVDVTKTPVPRFDLLNFKNYLNVNIQFSRGCPFLCEFCDIIELYGRKPRTKDTGQVLGELQALYDLGYRGHVDLVDDNLIGNKKAVKAFLPHLISWQKARNYPFEFSTEASLNLADDAELLQMLRAANFFTIFIGIESPDPDVLAMARKKQNTRREISDSIQCIYDAGITVIAGFIVGFDNESPHTATGMIDLIEDCSIPVCMVGLLYAMPNTQLSRRLEKEGRLYPENEVADGPGGHGDQCTSGINFDTLRPRQNILADYRAVVAHTYAPKNYFARVTRVGRLLNMSGPMGSINWRMLAHDAKQFIRLLWGITIHRPDMRVGFWKAITICLVTNPRATKSVIKMLALYAHLGRFSGYVIDQIDLQIKAVETGQWQPNTMYENADFEAAE